MERTKGPILVTQRGWGGVEEPERGWGLGLISALPSASTAGPGMQVTSLGGDSAGVPSPPKGRWDQPEPLTSGAQETALQPVVKMLHNKGAGWRHGARSPPTYHVPPTWIPDCVLPEGIKGLLPCHKLAPNTAA